MRSKSVTDGTIIEHIEDLTDVVEMIDAIPDFVADAEVVPDLPDLVRVRFRNVATRRAGTSAEWPPPPKKPAPTSREARIYRAVIRPGTPA
jgi:hypothetical protein